MYDKIAGLYPATLVFGRRKPLCRLGVWLAPERGRGGRDYLAVCFDRSLPACANNGRTLSGIASWLIAGVAVPAGVIVLYICVYNAARFGNPLQFGHVYQIGSVSEGFASARYLWHNLQIYYLFPPTLNWYFPFFSPGMEGSRPLGYIGVEHAHGEWLFVPFVAALALVWLARRKKLGQPDVAFLVASLFIWFAVNLVVLCAISVRANRYSLDFHPALVAMSAIGLLAVGTIRFRGRWLATLACMAWVFAVCVFNWATSFQTQGFMRDNLPEVYQSVSVAANRVVWPVQAALGRTPGPELYSIVFKEGKPGSSEPLLFAGSSNYEDELRVEYESPTSARLYFDHAFYGTIKGRPFAFIPGKTYKLSVTLGTFFPPIGHPWYRNITVPQQRWLRAHSRVMLDDQEVLAGDSPTFEGTPDKGSIGVACDNELAEARFSGELRFKSVLPVDLKVLAHHGEARGRERLWLRFPRDRFGLTEPLVAAGYFASYDLVTVDYVDPGHVSFGVEVSGGSVPRSKPVAVDYSVEHRIDVLMGPLRTTADEAGPLSESKVEVWLDGTRAYSTNCLQHYAPADEIYIGCKPWPGNGSRAIFGGEIGRVERIGVSPKEIADNMNSSAATETTVAFPDGHYGQSQPLFFRGIVGNADCLFVTYLNEHTIRFGFDCWGSGEVLSPPVSIDYDQPHTLKFIYGKFLPDSDPSQPQKIRLFVKDGGSL